ncbi:DUF1127 domain-containing protein [Mesorhizobium sp. LSJC264A00]|uniref:DUF1127 domain-containing protein n=1 Tax=unclassified Mesorhizobium TaxID=325217 RepID=UPI0003CE35A6|nr:DUF1127 domain-containing protein [Mesorhizobium sp. LSJC264A00]ESX19610.1 hypothetical protein X767_23045 [Mesorhizobium sp. LSJC264A00]
MSMDIMKSNGAQAAAPGGLYRFGGWLRSVAEARAGLQTRRAIALHDIRILDGFSDQQLIDIGVSRSDIVGAVTSGHRSTDTTRTETHGASSDDDHEKTIPYQDFTLEMVVNMFDRPAVSGDSGTTDRSQQASGAPADGVSPVRSMFTKRRWLTGFMVVLAAIAGAVAVSADAHAGKKIQGANHDFSQLMKRRGTVAIDDSKIFHAAPRSNMLVEARRLGLNQTAGKIGCHAFGCKAKKPILNKDTKLPCKVVGCKPGKPDDGHHGHHNGHHHGRHNHDFWLPGGVTIVASDHGGCSYEFWKWKMTGWRFWRHSYLACRGWNDRAGRTRRLYLQPAGSGQRAFVAASNTLRRSG